jgi:hypothetical protein
MNPDAKLVALGKQLEEIQERLRPVRAEHWRLAYEVANYVRGVTGYDHFGSVPPLSEPYSAAARQMDERSAFAARQMEERSGFNACDKVLSGLTRELDQIMRKIARLPATSIAGLRVKTLAAIEANDDLWNVPAADLDYDKEAVRSLIEAACAISGVTLPQEEHGALGDDSPPSQHHGSAALN